MNLATANVRAVVLMVATFASIVAPALSVAQPLPGAPAAPGDTPDGGELALGARALHAFHRRAAFAATR